MNLWPFVLDRNVDRTRDAGAERFVTRNTECMALWQLVAPTRSFLVEQIEYSQRLLRVRLEELTPVGERIRLRASRELIDECFHHKRRVRVAHRTPPKHGYIDLRMMNRDVKVG